MPKPPPERVPQLGGSLTLVALFAVGAASVVGYSFYERLDVGRASPPELASSARRQSAQTRERRQLEARLTSPPSEHALSPESTPADTVARWKAEATGADSATRGTAILALGNAPRAQAIPILESVLSVADEVDRPLALSALRKLAQNQGDADDRIRNAIRKVVYHGSDEAVSASAQSTLESIERDLAHR